MDLSHRTPSGGGGAGRYSWFVLSVLCGTSFLNYADRQVVSILAQAIKADLRVTDAQLGFLLGTAFAIFYAVLGLSMGRIADAMDRTRLMALGLATWSAMTALGAAATSFGALAVARIGVGVGEATANPCSNSLLAEYFPSRRRAMAMGIYLAGGFLGSACALLLGGFLLQHWRDLCGLAPFGACRAPAWKAALVIIGAPGLLLAVAVDRLREPPRAPRAGASLLALAAEECATAAPPFTLIAAARIGGRKALAQNLGLLLLAGAVAAICVRLTGDVMQWCAVGFGGYAIASWAQILRLRDRPLFDLTFGRPAFRLAMVSSALIACMSGGVNVWAAPYAMRVLKMSPTAVGAALGLTFAASAGLAVVFGGWATDRLKARDPRAPVWTALVAVLGALPSLAGMLLARSPGPYILSFALFNMFATSYAGGYAALVQDLVLPRMRGAASAALALLSVVISSGFGPYLVGKVSTTTGSLRLGLSSVTVFAPVALLVIFFAAKRLRGEGMALREAPAPQEPDVALT